MSVTHYVATNYPKQFKGVLMCDTTIGLDETQQFVKDECKRHGWRLWIRRPPRQTFEEWVLKYGFPSQRIHTQIMRIIKYEAMRKFLFERYDIGEKPCFVGGARRKESLRRMKNMADPISRDGRVWFCNPFIDKSTEWVYAYLTEHKLKKSPSYTNLHISGDCLCGAFAGSSEIMLLRAFYPKIYQKIKSIEERVKVNKDIPDMFKGWGNHNTALDTEYQTTLDALICGECSIY
jgi:phosphoadenosine phosphosulfate reductase